MLRLRLALASGFAAAINRGIMKHFAMICCLCLGSAGVAMATPFSVTEGGDFSNLLGGPTNLGLSLDAGINTISGTLTGGSFMSGDLLDALVFSKPPGVQISSIKIIVTGFSGSATILTGLGVAGSATGFVQVTGNGTFNLPLFGGGGSSVMLSISSPLSGFALGAFSYTIEIEATAGAGPDPISEAPEPAASWLCASGVAALAAFTRLKARGPLS